MNPRFFKPNREIFPEPLPAIVDEAIAPNSPGRVAWNGSHYPAKLYDDDVQALQPGQQCYVVGREGITRLVIA